MTKAKELFEQGYNCAQSVFCTHCEKVGIDFETGLKLSSSFGGGMGRLREVCGAVSAMLMLIGLKEGYTSPNDDKIKEEHYAKVQSLAKELLKNIEDIYSTIEYNKKTKKTSCDSELKTWCNTYEKECSHRRDGLRCGRDQRPS